MVEFRLVAPLFFFLMFAVFDFGRLFLVEKGKRGAGGRPVRVHRESSPGSQKPRAVSTRANMLEKNGPMLNLFIAAADVRALQKSLADRICYRCKRKYSDHRDADHRFFEYAEDLDPEEAN
jgi:hypothetical protein